MVHRPLSALLRPVLAAATVLALPMPLSAQFEEGDDRDRVVFSSGKEERGRLVWRWDEDGEIHWRTPRGRVRRYDSEDVLQLDLVSERMGAWLQARSPRASLDEEWALVEVALDSALPSMARAQAYHLLSRDPSNERAHEFLGHEKRRDGSWHWAVEEGKRKLPFDRWVEHNRDTGHPFTLEGEHFTLRTTVDYGRAVDLLFDMERAYHEFQKEFRGSDSLGPYEILARRINVWVYSDEEEFPALTGAERGYYLPGLALAPSSQTPFVGSGNDVVTYYEGQGSHPLEFFELITQALLYNCVLGESGGLWEGAEWGLYRENATFEIGLGNWFGSQFVGRPGYVSRQAFRLSPEDAALARARSEVVALAEPRKELPNLIGLNYEFFHRNDERVREDSTARANAFFAFLMDPRNVFADGKREGEPTRNAILAYLRSVYRSASGASSSKFDDALGLKVERLTAPYHEWLKQF